VVLADGAFGGFDRRGGEFRPGRMAPVAAPPGAAGGADGVYGVALGALEAGFLEAAGDERVGPHDRVAGTRRGRWP
jgi:hypothetical protein